MTQTKAERRSQTAKVASRRRRPRATFLSRHQTIINFWLDTALLLVFLLMAWVSIIVRFAFPPAEAAAGYTLWGVTLSQWIEIQFGVLAAFTFGIILHLMLHWYWVCGVITARLSRKPKRARRPMDDGQRTILGVGLLIVVLNIMGLAIAAAVLSIQSPI